MNGYSIALAEIFGKKKRTSEKMKVNGKKRDAANKRKLTVMRVGVAG